MKKRIYLKSWLESTLITIEILIISFFAITIDNLGNPTYNKITIVLMIILIANDWVLTHFGKTIIEANK